MSGAAEDGSAAAGGEVVSGRAPPGEGGWLFSSMEVSKVEGPKEKMDGTRQRIESDLLRLV